MGEKKGAWKKVVIGTAAVGTLMWAADRYDITARIGDAWEGTKAYVVDVLTTDPAEAGVGYLGELKEEQSLAPYEKDIASTVLGATAMLRDSAQAGVINGLLAIQPYETRKGIVQGQALELELGDQVDLSGLLERNIGRNIGLVPDDKKTLWQKLKEMPAKAYDWGAAQYHKVF
ncbi:hypothetical protein JXB02_02265 [Candidatus Woesearchaeota archaeon]|nr:hypothetical protein [Candidatus Woesearchaeota archaeon]